MTATRRKIDEAKYFLDQLEQHYYEHPIGNYLLSAFISSARSVLWIMKSEYQEVNGWLNWYDQKKPEVGEERILKGVNSIRVRSEKIEPISTKTRIVMNIPKENAIPELIHWFENELSEKRILEVIAIPRVEQSSEIQNSVSKNLISFTCRIEDIYRIVDEFPDEDILKTCKTYCLMLASLVDECEKLFSCR